MFDKVREVMRVPSKVSFLIATGAVDLALGLISILVCGAVEGAHEAADAQHIDFAILVLFVDG